MTRDETASTTNGLAGGHNNLGGLGTGHTAQARKPTHAPVVPAGTVDLQGGTDFTVALTDSGDVFSWGGNARGQLGAGRWRSGRSARQVELPKIAAISVGAGHVLAATRT